MSYGSLRRESRARAAGLGREATRVCKPPTVNNVSVTPSFASLAGAGLHQLNLTVPSGLGKGDVPLRTKVGGVQTLSGVVISLQ